MILQKWNKALIDWVNCLSLTGQITIIEELKSGEFFRLLLKKFTSSAALTECTSDSFDDIYNLLEKEFPLYGVREIERDEFKLSYIASLLLLLSVTKEETPMFQSNLCEKLPHDSQVKIKCFLESCLETTNELNHSYLKTILEGDVVSHCQNSTKVKDNVSFKTPMKDFFDSPRQTNKLKRDLKRLEEENESLLLEKLELEDELRSVKENKQQIEEALLQKNEQVLKLREELQDFIHNSNANLVENDVSSQSLSAIKSELRDLEIYVTELQEEKTALIEEKEKLQEKLTALQCKNKDLEFQTEYSENKQQELLAMLHKRDEEVFSLRERCSELEEKINAIQPAHNISIESDSSIPIGIISSPYAGERLSQAVVDVKLQEVEEENERFKDQVKMLTDQRNNLTNQIKEVKEDLAKERREFRDCTAKLESLMIELGELKDSIVSKENSLQQFETNLKEKEGLIKSLETVLETETSEKKQLVLDILSLQNNIKLLEETKEEILMENSNFKIQILQLSGKLSALEMSLELKEKNILNMKEELASRSVLADNLRLEITKYEEELSIMKEENYCMKETISLKQRECNEMKEEMINKDNLITEIKNDTLTKERVIEEIREELRKKNNVLHSLESAHKALEKDAKLIKRELEQKIVQLQEKESIAAKDQQEIIECREEIDKLLVELNVVNQNCVLKDNTLHELNQELSECKDKIKTLEETKLSFLSEKKELESKIHSLLDNIKHMEETKEGIVMENSQYKDQISLCEREITDLKTLVEEKEAKLVVLDDELSSKCMLYEGLQKKLNKCQDEIESLNQEKSCLADRVSAKEKECEQFKEEVASRNILIAKLESDVLTMGRSMEEMRIELSNKTLSLQAVQSAQEVLESEKQLLKGELEQKIVQLQEKEIIAAKDQQEIIECREEIDKLLVELNVVNQNCVLKDNTLHELNQELRECKDKIKTLEETKLSFLSEKKELESKIHSLLDNIKHVEETKEGIVMENSQYKDQISLCEQEITDLKTLVEEKEAKLVVLDDELSSKCMLYEGLQKKLNKCQDEIESLNQEKSCLADRISAKEKECEQFKEEVASRNILIAKLESDALTMGRSMEEMRIELSNKTLSLQAVQSAQEVLESEKQVLIGELEQTKCLVSEKENIAREAEQEILEYEDKLKKLNSEMENFKYKLHESNDRNKSCVETMLIEKKELESSILSLRAYVKLTEETKEEILKENSHYKNQVLDYVSKITELETKLEDKEGKIVTLNNELSSKCNLLEQIEENFKKCQVGMESLEKERSSLADRNTLKEKECEELMEKIDNKDCIVAKFENDNLTKEKIITELREKLTEKTNLVKKFESIQQALEAEKFQLNTELEQMKTFVSEKESIFEMANQEILEHLDRIEKLNLEIKDIKDQLCGSHDKIRVLEDREMAVVKERDILQSNLLSLKSNVKCLEESKAEILNENSVYKNQVLEFEGKLSNLQSKLDEKERKIIFLAEEVSLKNCLIESKEVMIKECQDEIEIMKKEKSYTEENSILSEKREKELERKISKMEATINSLEATNECLMSEKKETLLLVNEQRITIEVLQQKLDSLNEEKMILDDKICWWKEQCVAFEKMLEELKLQDSSNKVGLGNVDDSIKSFGNKENTVNELEHVSLSKNDEHKAIVSNLEDSTNQSSHEYRDKDDHLDESDVNSENIEFCLEKAVEEEKLKQLDVGKIMLLVSSWHDIDEKLENLRGIEHRIKIKIGSLWESIPKIQSKLKEKSDMDSAQSSIQETGNRKEVIMRIISMVRSLEKNFSSLEKELVQASTNAVSWGLQGIQNQFNVVTNIPNSDNGNIDLNSKNEQRNAFSSYLDILKDKVSQALEDVNSSVDIFREVECRSENVTEVLEYLKKNCLYEQELLCDFDYEGFQITLTEEETRKRFVKAMDEMEKAKENLERITCESQKEVERLQNEKESLVKDLQSVTSRCSLLESKLEMSEKQVELAVRETQQRIQKIFEKKLETTKEKLKSLYMDDLKKYEEECKLRKQFEESFKKYRSLTENYEKRLAEANAKNDDLRSKVQNLQHQKSCIEIKLRESMAKNFIEDDRRDSLDSGVYRSNYVDAMANYFARNNTSSPSHSFFDSQRDTNHDSISRTFSRESVQSSLPSGKVFCAEDEEGELFNATYLNDLNEGKCIVPSNRASKVEACSGILRESNKQSIRNPAFDEESPNRRMKELMRRNTLCLPHLKSSYPTETQFHDPKNFPEELLKGNFSLKAPLLGDKQPRRLSGNIYGDLRRKKDIGQITYMKPGPPTPGKNRRTSLQGGEQGSEQGKIPSTPGRFRSWFARGKKTAPNDVENIPCTPRTKQKGLFQRAIANLERDGS